MPNLYGVANAGIYSFIQAQGSEGDKVIPPNVWTTFIFTGQVIAPSQGWFQPVVWVSFQWLNGATPPTNVSIGAAIGAGAVFDAANFDGVFYGGAGTYFKDTMQLIGPPSDLPWRSPGSVINVQCNASTNGVTMRSYQARCTVMLVRAPDQ